MTLIKREERENHLLMRIYPNPQIEIYNKIYLKLSKTRFSVFFIYSIRTFSYYLNIFYILLN